MVRLRCICSASAVRLRIVVVVEDVVEDVVVSVKVGVAVAVCSAIAADWLW